MFPLICWTLLASLSVTAPAILRESTLAQYRLPWHEAALRHLLREQALHRRQIARRLLLVQRQLDLLLSIHLLRFLSLVQMVRMLRLILSSNLLIDVQLPRELLLLLVLTLQPLEQLLLLLHLHLVQPLALLEMAGWLVLHCQVGVGGGLVALALVERLRAVVGVAALVGVVTHVVAWDRCSSGVVAQAGLVLGHSLHVMRLVVLDHFEVVLAAQDPLLDRWVVGLGLVVLDYDGWYSKRLGLLASLHDGQAVEDVAAVDVEEALVDLVRALTHMPLHLLDEIILLALLQDFLAAAIQISFDLGLWNSHVAHRELRVSYGIVEYLLSEFYLCHVAQVCLDFLTFVLQLANHMFYWNKLLVDLWL